MVGFFSSFISLFCPFSSSFFSFSCLQPTWVSSPPLALMAFWFDSVACSLLKAGQSQGGKERGRARVSGRGSSNSSSSRRRWQGSFGHPLAVVATSQLSLSLSLCWPNSFGRGAHSVALVSNIILSCVQDHAHTPTTARALSACLPSLSFSFSFSLWWKHSSNLYRNRSQ